MAMRPLPKLIVIVVGVVGLAVTASKFMPAPTTATPSPDTVPVLSPATPLPPVHPALVERERPGVVTAAQPAVVPQPVPQPDSPPVVSDPSKDRGLANLLQSR